MYDVCQPKFLLLFFSFPLFFPLSFEHSGLPYYTYATFMCYDVLVRHLWTAVPLDDLHSPSICIDDTDETWPRLRSWICIKVVKVYRTPEIRGIVHYNMVASMRTDHAKHPKLHSIGQICGQLCLWMTYILHACVLAILMRHDRG